MSNAARKMVPAGETSGNTKYAKTRALKPEEVTKGCYVSLSNGDSIAGVLKSSVINTFGKPDYTIELTNGSNLVISGAGNLPSRMNSVTPGTYVEITYKGKQTIKNGPQKGKESHQFEVLKEEV